jgi:excisionase family DNA binding protein
VNQRLLTTREVAERLSVSPETVLRRVRAGQLPAIRLASNALRIREAELELFLERSAYRRESLTTPARSCRG